MGCNGASPRTPRPSRTRSSNRCTASARALRYEEDPARQDEINRRVRAVALHLLLAYRVEIGGYIERVVRNWEPSTLVEQASRLSSRARTCKFIRINGTLVGGLVGLLIFIASKWIAAL